MAFFGLIYRLRCDFIDCGSDYILQSGDSWSNIDFNWLSTQPTLSNPLGNPNYTVSDVAANGARWPVYLTITSNASRLLTYDLAQTGGVIDNSITPHVNDFVNQITKGFLPTYGNASSGNWTAGTTLFISFFGVNDVNLVLPMKNTSAYFDRMFVSYQQSIEKVCFRLDENISICGLLRLSSSFMELVVEISFYWMNHRWTLRRMHYLV